MQSETINLGEQQRTSRQRLEQANLALQQARLASEQATRQANWQQEQRQRLQDQIDLAENEVGQLHRDLAALEIDVNQTREHLRERNNNLAEMMVDEYLTQVAHWNMRAAVIERALGDERRRLEERQQALEKSTAQFRLLQDRLDDLKKGRQALVGEKMAAHTEEAQINQSILALQQVIEPGEAELRSLESEQTKFEEADAIARQTVSLADHRHAQSRIILARRQEALQSLQRRIEEDFGLVAFDYAEQVSGQAPLPLEGMVEQLPRLTQLAPEIEEAIKRQRAQLRRIGPINPEAQAEYKTVKERFNFMTEQIADLRRAEEDIREVIQELDGLMQRDFVKTFEAVAIEFKAIFQRLFGGGSARLVLTDPENLTDTGIDIEARLPGRRTQGLSLLSGGERSLTATSLVFALIKVSPTPFCVLDEVDAMLDEANVGRFRELLQELSQRTQFVIVTHNRNTVQAADVIYGVTMGRDSASQVVSLKMDQVAQVFE
jgi:chromosome segregation protein